jgi:hypothetical protein
MGQKRGIIVQMGRLWGGGGGLGGVIDKIRVIEGVSIIHSMLRIVNKVSYHPHLSHENQINLPKSRESKSEPGKKKAKIQQKKKSRFLRTLLREYRTKKDIVPDSTK